MPHSEIPGSTIARISPGLFAACHVLHRLSVPRHPPDALHSRLSAAPNGKNHRETQSCESKTLVERYPVRGLDPRITRGPPLGRQSSLPAEPGGTSCRQSRSAHRRCADSIGSAVEDTHRDPPRPDLAARATERSRLGHTIRLFTSVHQQVAHRHPDQGAPAAISASCRVSGCGAASACRSAFRRKLRFRLSARRNFGAAQLRSAGSGGERVRTDDLLLAKQALSQLSYTPVPGTRDQEPGIRKMHIPGAWFLIPGS